MTDGDIGEHYLHAVAQLDGQDYHNGRILTAGHDRTTGKVGEPPNNHASKCFFTEAIGASWRTSCSAEVTISAPSTERTAKKDPTWPQIHAIVGEETTTSM